MLEVPLTKGYVALIDDEDADLLANRYWATENGPRHVYAQRAVPAAEGGGKVHLHREVAERAFGPIPKGKVVDHINHDTLDTRRANLRVIPHRANIWHQNGAGRDSKSGVRGVRFRKGRWQAYICEGLKMFTLGTFDTIEEARDARLAAEAARLEKLAA